MATVAHAERTRTRRRPLSRRLGAPGPFTYLFEPLKQGATGGSARQYQTVVMYLYEKAFAGTQFDFGYAAAIGWALFLLIGVIALVNLLIVRRIRSVEH